tara:strand:+ start:53 stop:763 length:711 start_codon:yes stop_codon:yes gene_type:complete
MSHLILVRHGQSEWNLEKKFTGWVDVDLTASGKLEACKAGELIKDLKMEISFCYSSYQKRALNTLKLILNTIRVKNDDIIKAWQLNERHYGELTGLNKDQMQKKFGKEKIFKFRRSWDYPPKPLNRNNPYHPLNIDTYNDVPRDKIPDTESLKDTYDRVVKYYSDNIKKNLDRNILVAAHGNSIRALCKYLFDLDNEVISKLEIPTGNPLLITFDNNIVKEAKYLDASRAKNLLKF